MDAGTVAVAGPEPATRLSRPPGVGLVSLGCPKALVDSERILTELSRSGYALSRDYAGADVVVVNTCGFLDSAKEESLEAIGEAMAKNGRVIVTGCMGADAERIRARFPGVLAITGPQATEAVVAAVREAAPLAATPFLDLVPDTGLKLTPRHYSYLKIAEGCNHACAFCIIPQLRGRLVSRRPDAILREAERLVAAGTRELLIISQDTSAYGRDLAHARFGKSGLRAHITDLARALGQLGTRDRPVWVRLHYVYPYAHVDELIPLMAEGLILPYLDIPFQHASPRILKAMRRPARDAETLARIRRWRAMVPDLAIRSTFIAGFPGETEEDFAHLLDWLEEAELDRVGCFAFEPVEGAAACALPGLPPREVREERRERFMAHAAAISARKLRRRVGQTIPVLVDEADGEGGATGRSTADAPEIDGRVLLRDAHGVQPGDMLMATVEDSDAFDLYGAPAGR
jgi:ribosomal protein S12 methylthiotransferase